MFRTPEHNIHIHVFSPDSPEIERYLLFRDRLRTNDNERNLYEAVKRRLAAQSWADMNEYAEQKTDVVESIIKATRKEKK